MCDPATGEAFATVPDSAAVDAQAATTAAHSAFDGWRRQTTRERAQFLRRWHALILAYTDDTPYGLAAYFYSRDVSRIWRLADRLQTGMVGINEGALAAEAAPFGGLKESGYGREGSRYGLDDYMHTKYLCQGGLT